MKLIFGWALGVMTLAAQGPLASRVLVIYNSHAASQAESLDVANHYVSERGIPAGNLCGISFPNVNQVTFTEWLTVYRTSVRNCLDQASGGRANVLYVVMSYKTPFLLVRPSPYTPASLDSHVADAWDAYSTSYFPSVPAGTHRYFANAQSAGNVYPEFKTLAAYRAEARAALIYSVWRLDGDSVATAKGLVTKAKAAEAQGGGLAGGGGTVYADLRFGPNPEVQLADNDHLSGDIDLNRMATMARSAGLTVVEDQNNAEIGVSPAPLTAPDAMLYSGWYQLLNYNPVFTWKTGAIGWHLDSASATSPRSGNSWAAKALQAGITVTSGSVNEPYLEGLAHPDIVTRHLLMGGNAGDAFLRGTAWLKWMILNIGDPLYVPFPGGRAPFNAPLAEDTLQVSRTWMVNGSVDITLTTSDPAPVGGRVINWTNFYYTTNVTRLPLTTTIPAGQRTATVSFSVTNPVANPEQYIAIRIYANFDGRTARNSVLMTSLLNVPYAASTSFQAGGSTQGAIVLNGTGALGGTVVNLSSSHPGVVQVPASVTVPAGTQAVFFKYISPAGSVAAPTEVTITATTGPFVATRKLTIQP